MVLLLVKHCGDDAVLTGSQQNWVKVSEITLVIVVKQLSRGRESRASEIWPEFGVSVPFTISAPL